MLSILSHRGNANQTRNETTLHTPGQDQNKIKTSVDENVEKPKPLDTAGGNKKWSSCFGKQLDS